MATSATQIVAMQTFQSQKRRMRAVLLYVLPILLLLIALFAIGSRRNSGDEQPTVSSESNDAGVFLKIFALGGVIAVGIFVALEFN